MRRFIWLVFLPAGLAAQRPAASPVLPRLLARVQDTKNRTEGIVVSDRGHVAFRIAEHATNQMRVRVNETG